MKKDFENNEALLQLKNAITKTLEERRVKNTDRVLNTDKVLKKNTNQDELLKNIATEIELERTFSKTKFIPTKEEVTIPKKGYSLQRRKK